MNTSRQRGVIAYLRSGENGEIILVLDDVEGQSSAPDEWTKTWFFTSRSIAERDLDEMNVPDHELADIGMMLLARLRALTMKKPEEGDGGGAGDGP